MRVAALRAGCLAGLLLAVAACSGDPEPERAPVAADVAFLSDLQVVRQQRVLELTQPDGWLSLVGLHWIEPGAHYVGRDAGNGIRLAMGPAHLGMIERRGSTLRFVPDRGTAITLDGQPLSGATVLRADDDPAGPSILGFDDTRGSALVLRRGDRYALRVRHADAPARTAFQALEYWPADVGWRVQARYVAHPPGTTQSITDIVGTALVVPNPGVVEFERDGARHRLEVVVTEGRHRLIFADGTSAKGSYSAGRYLDLDAPIGEGALVIDFNRSYNPPCAFTAFSTCPLPPDDNRLALPITAGERAYAKRG